MNKPLIITFLLLIQFWALLILKLCGAIDVSWWIIPEPLLALVCVFIIASTKREANHAE